MFYYIKKVRFKSNKIVIKIKKINYFAFELFKIVNNNF